MTVVWEDLDEDIDYFDALDLPPCPRCRSSAFAHDRELKAFICDACGLWVDDDEDID